MNDLIFETVIQLKPQVAAEPAILLTDLIPLERLQNLQEMYAKTNGVSVGITDPDGGFLSSPSNSPELCRLIQRTDKGKEHCQLTYKLLCDEVSDGKAPAWRECMNCGFIEAAIPIVVGGQHVANWIIGQSNVTNVNSQRIEEYAWVIGADVLTIRRAAQTMPVMPFAQFKQLVRQLNLFLNEIHQLAYQNYVTGQQLDRQQQTERDISQKSLELVRSSAEWQQFINRISRELQEMLDQLSVYLDRRDELSRELRGIQGDLLLVKLMQKIRHTYRMVLDRVAVEHTHRADLERGIRGLGRSRHP